MRRAEPGSRRLQGGQRHAWPSDRRRLAAGGGAAAVGGGARDRHRCPPRRRRVRHHPGRPGLARRRRRPGRPHHPADPPAVRHRGRDNRHRHQHRRRDDSRGRHIAGQAAEERRHRAVSREDGGPRHVPLFRAGDGCAPAMPPPAGTRSAQGAAGERLPSALSADHCVADRQRGGVRGADPVEPPGAGTCSPGRIHSHRRGNRPDRPHRRVGAAAGVRGRAGLAGGYRRVGQPVLGPVQGRPAFQCGAGRLVRLGPGPGTFDPGDYRVGHAG